MSWMCMNAMATLALFKEKFGICCFTCENDYPISLTQQMSKPPCNVCMVMNKYGEVNNFKPKKELLKQL